ncbi:MAG: hypothetical protein JOZ05_17825 [Acetobacteraceae bacterium]|nr:hypothetical protein [Acetobacteraceae bacterium]
MPLIATVFGFGLPFLLLLPINGILLSALWDWFLSSVTGLRHISIAEGVGLAMFFSIVVSGAKTWEGSEIYEPGDTALAVMAKGAGAFLGAGVLGPALVLALAWAWQQFVVPQFAWLSF